MEQDTDTDGWPGRRELDSHADTCCVGRDTVVLELTGETVNVKPFSDEYDAMEGIPVATIATAYENEWGETIILVLNEALYFGEALSHSLWCPNQLRANGLIVEDPPKQFDKESTHSIKILKSKVTLPLRLHGIVYFLPTKKTSQQELEDCERHILTAEA